MATQMMVHGRTANLADDIVIFAGAIRAMILIRFAIGMFALTLLGLAISLSAAQSEQNTRAEAAVLSQR
jgi:hypothetical protein